MTINYPAMPRLPSRIASHSNAHDQFTHANPPIQPYPQPTPTAAHQSAQPDWQQPRTNPPTWSTRPVHQLDASCTHSPIRHRYRPITHPPDNPPILVDISLHSCTHRSSPTHTPACSTRLSNTTHQPFHLTHPTHMHDRCTAIPSAHQPTTPLPRPTRLAPPLDTPHTTHSPSNTRFTGMPGRGRCGVSPISLQPIHDSQTN